MGEELTGGPNAGQSGWMTTKVAARMLRVDPRTVRKYIKQGKLVARFEGEDVEKTYLVSVDSLHELRSSRPDPRVTREDVPRDSAGVRGYRGPRGLGPRPHRRSKPPLI
jgi:hypothetical protein